MKQITAVEIMLSYISIGWAYVLFTTPTLFETSKNWEKVASIANYEWILGIITLVCAAVKIVGMILNNKRLRWFGLLLSTALWVVVATGFLIADDNFKLTTGFIVYSAIAVTSLMVSKEVMTSDNTQKQRGVGRTD